MKVTPRLAAIDALVVCLLLLVAASPLRDAYGGWQWAVALGVGGLGGFAIAAVSAWQRWGAWLTVLTALLWYLLAGTGAALSDLGMAGVVPTAESLRALLTGAITAWRNSLTLVPPIGSAGDALIVPFLGGLLAALLAGVILWRSTRPGAASFVIVAVFLGAAAFGDRFAEWPATRGLVLVVGLLVWTRFRALRAVRANWVRRGVLAAVVLAVALGASVGVNAVAGGPQTRTVLRDAVQPPFDPQDYPSPLSRYRAYLKTMEKTSLFTVEGVSTGDRLRLATLDYFDGVVWNVTGGPRAPKGSGSFRRMRSPVGLEGSSRIAVTVDGYSGVWLPAVGRPIGVAAQGAEGEVVGNDVTGTLAQVGGVQSGTRYEIEVVAPDTIDDSAVVGAAAGGQVVAAPRDVPSALMKKVTDWFPDAGPATAGATAKALADKFAEEGKYSNGVKPDDFPVRSGHGARRISDFITARDMVGNDEQYASAYALALQRLGIPARVVLGFDVTGPVIHGSDVTAWVEVSLNGLGWVPFDPTPDQDQTLQEQRKEPEPLPQPQILQPQDAPQSPDDLDDNPPHGAAVNDDKPLWGFLLKLLEVAGSVAVVAGKAALLTSPLWLLPLFKVVRRRRRARHHDPLRRMTGGWRELADRGRDLGTTVPAAATRSEAGGLLDDRYRTLGATALAARADRQVFGPFELDEAEVDAYWADVRSALKRMRKEARWWRRPLVWFSPASVPWRKIGARLGERADHLVRRVLATVVRVARPVTSRISLPTLRLPGGRR